MEVTVDLQLEIEAFFVFSRSLLFDCDDVLVVLLSFESLGRHLAK